MCVEVLVRKSGKEDRICEDVAGLADALGMNVRELSPDFPDSCLCVISNARWAELGAREAVDGDEGWPFTGFVIEKS
jgi:hypothetical protein